MNNRQFIVGGIIIALLIGVTAVFLASGDPDGLESTALVVQGEKTLTGGTPENAVTHEDTAGKVAYSSPMPDYTLGSVKGPLGGILPLFAGILLVFLAVFGATRVVKILSGRKEKTRDQDS
jgi:cobalt/nickel transport protein